MYQRKTVRKHIFFSGRVQGVGFRYRAYHIANDLGLTGWVQNCYDGRVEMEVQGQEPSIIELVNRLKEQPYISIEEIQSDDIPLKKDKSFGIAN